MRKGKTRAVTVGGRLVTRAQLQAAANQIASVVAGALRKLEEKYDARLAVIEKELGLNVEYAAPKDERTLMLVPPVADVATDGSESESSEPVPA